MPVWIAFVDFDRLHEDVYAPRILYKADLRGSKYPGKKNKDLNYIWILESGVETASTATVCCCCYTAFPANKEYFDQNYKKSLGRNWKVVKHLATEREMMAHFCGQECGCVNSINDSCNRPCKGGQVFAIPFDKEKNPKLYCFATDLFTAYACWPIMPFLRQELFTFLDDSEEFKAQLEAALHAFRERKKMAGQATEGMTKMTVPKPLTMARDQSGLPPAKEDQHA